LYAGDLCRLRFFKFWRCFCISKIEHQINGEIRDKEIRLISAQGEQLGIMSAREAMRIAEEQDLDLVKIAPQAKPPVCRIMDYGKFKFEQDKREREARKNQRVIEIKEIRMSPGIDVHDFNVKARKALTFLKSGDKVKAVVRFKGRELAHTNIGLDLLKRFAETCAEYSNIEKPPKLEGRHMSMFLSPKAADKSTTK
jgi:translation initiation factor IF-3